MDIDQLLQVRGASYGDAWLKTSRWIQEHTDMLKELGDAAFPIIMIMSKLYRLEADPRHLDNIYDIAGYAELAVQAIDCKDAPVNSPIPDSSAVGSESITISEDIKPTRRFTGIINPNRSGK